MLTNSPGCGRNKLLNLAPRTDVNYIVVSESLTLLPPHPLPEASCSIKRLSLFKFRATNTDVNYTVVLTRIASSAPASVKDTAIPILRPLSSANATRGSNAPASAAAGSWMSRGAAAGHRSVSSQGMGMARCREERAQGIAPKRRDSKGQPRFGRRHQCLGAGTQSRTAKHWVADVRGTKAERRGCADSGRSREDDHSAGVDPQRTLSLRDGNGSSCPKPDAC